MTISVRKTLWSGSASKSLLIGLGLFLFTFGCAHTPSRSHKSLGRVYLTVEARGATDVVLVLMRSRSDSPAVAKIQARRRNADTWSVDLDLIPGEYRFFFLVDGVVMVDGGRNRMERDDFGGITGVLTVRRMPDGRMKVY